MIQLEINDAPKCCINGVKVLKNYLEEEPIYELKDIFTILDKCAIFLSDIKTEKADYVRKYPEANSIDEFDSFFTKLSTEIGLYLLNNTIEFINQIIKQELPKDYSEIDIRKSISESRDIMCLIDSLDVSSSFRENHIIHNIKIINGICDKMHIEKYENVKDIPRLFIFSEYELYNKCLKRDKNYAKIFVSRYPNSKYFHVVMDILETLEYQECINTTQHDKQQRKLLYFYENYPTSKYWPDVKKRLYKSYLIKSKYTPSEFMKRDGNLIYITISIVVIILAFILSDGRTDLYSSMLCIGAGVALMAVARVLRISIEKKRLPYVYYKNNAKPDLWNLSLVGVNLYGIKNAKRYKNDGKEYEVRYVFFSILGFPLVCQGCYASSYNHFQFTNGGKRMITHYNIYGKQKTDIAELIYVYLNYWGVYISTWGWLYFCYMMIILFL